MATKKRRKPLFDRLRQALEEGIAFSRGELTLRTVQMPEEPPQVDAETLTSIRQRARMSQAVFAKVLNVSAKTVQSWEQGKRRPSQASLRLIEIFSQQPQVICELVGLKLAATEGGTPDRLAERVGVSGRKRLVARNPTR